jgi:WhiB family transcriptional regulator, redox-sensing transcriptional regulator
MSGAGDGGAPLADWRRLAACRSADPDLFFPVSSEGGGGGGQVEKAKALCGACGVRRQCLQHAIGGDEVYGVWGGLTGDERSRFSWLARAGSRPRGGLTKRIAPVSSQLFPHF